MDVLFCCYSAHVLSIVGFYPYRDYVASLSRPPFPLPSLSVSYCTSRWKGMLLNPSQPLLLSVPGSTLVYMTVSLNSIWGDAAACMAHGLLRSAIKVYSLRFSAVRNVHGDFVYSSAKDCLVRATKTYGALSWFVGAIPTAIISYLWHVRAVRNLMSSDGAMFFPMYLPRRRYHHHQHGHTKQNLSFLETWAQATAVSATNAVLCCPLHNAFRSALVRRLRSHSLRGVHEYCVSEWAILREAMLVSRSTLRLREFQFFFNGIFSRVGKTCVPFGFSWAVFRYCESSMRSSA